MTTKETLEAARAKIENRSTWMRGELTNGHAYCALGAIGAVEGDKKGAKKALRHAVPPTWGAGGVMPGPIGWLMSAIFTEPRIFGYNDSQTHECVIAAFDAAIEKEEKCQPSA